MEINRRLYSGNEAWAGFEYWAGELEGMKVGQDPTWSVEKGSPSYVEAKKRAQ